MAVVRGPGARAAVPGLVHCAVQHIASALGIGAEEGGDPLVPAEVYAGGRLRSRVGRVERTQPDALLGEVT